MDNSHIIKEIIVQILGFGIVFLVLKQLSWKQILGAIDARRSKIESEFRSIDDKKHELEALEKEYRQKIERIEEEARQKIQAAAEIGKTLAKEVQDRALEDAKKMVERAKAEIANDLVKAKLTLRNEIVEISGLMTERIIKQKLAGRNPSMVVIDPSAKQESLDFAEYGVYPSETDLSHKRNIRPGILRIQELLRRGKIVVHPRCENLIREFESYQWDDKRSLDRNQGDQPRDKDNHALDAIRYLAMVAPDPSTEKKDEHMTPEQILVKKESEQIERAFNEVWRVKISMEDSYGADGTET